MITSKRVIVAMTDSQVDEGENKSKGDVGLGVCSNDVLSEKNLCQPDGDAGGKFTNDFFC